MHLQAFEHASRSSRPTTISPMPCTSCVRLRMSPVGSSLAFGLQPLTNWGLLLPQSRFLRMHAQTSRESTSVTLSATTDSPSRWRQRSFVLCRNRSPTRSHAQAQSVDVSIDLVDEFHVRITIQDDGIGFRPADVPEERFGLEGIRQRSRLLGGEASIVSEPGTGTLIQVILPLAMHSHGAS